MSIIKMSSQVTPYKNSTESKQVQIEKMFNHISDKYDLMNRVITFGMDKKWRDNVLKLILEKDPESILDIATGTGDMAILLAKTNAKHILGIDISKGMLDIANEKIRKLNLQERLYTEIQNSENLALLDNSFDAVTIIYGVRNFENLKKGLSETLRVIKPKGIVVILETSIPNNLFLKSGYLFYTKRVMPKLVNFFVKDKSAYVYLSNSAIKFPYGKDFVNILESVGFKNIKSIPQMYGISTIYYAEK